MAFPNPAARNQYLKTQVETASKEQLVVMLFDGIIRFTEQARKAIDNKEIEVSHNALMRAQAIVMELIVTVDKEKGGEVAKNLMALHAYSFNCLVQCNLRKDVTKIDEVQGIYRKLREGWVGAMESLGIVTGAQKAAAQAAAQAGAKAPVAAPAGGKPLPPGGGKPLPTGAASGALPATGRPAQQPGVGGGVLAARSGGSIASRPVPAAPAAAAGVKPVAAQAKPVSAATPAPVAPPAAPKAVAPAMAATGYGMGRSAAMAYGAKPVPVATTAKQAAALGAYQQSAGARSIA